MLADAKTAFERAERIAARKERQELEGKPIPERLQLNRYTMQREAAEREAAADVTPASKADLGRLQQVVTQLKSKLRAMGGRP